jgi:hypothetical protein
MTKFEEDAVEQIRSAINVIQVDENEVGRRLANLHPTLQQGFMRMIVGFLKEIAAKEYVDARNEAAHKLAKLLLEDVHEDNLYLPLI